MANSRKDNNQKNAQDTIINFLSCLEGYHQTLKGIHWSTKNHSEHLLVDDIDDSVLGFEDRIAENTMGLFGFRIGVGKLKTLLPQAEVLNSLLNEMKDDVLELKEEIEEDVKNSGLINILDEFLENINKWKYLETLK